MSTISDITPFGGEDFRSIDIVIENRAESIRIDFGVRFYKSVESLESIENLLGFFGKVIETIKGGASAVQTAPSVIGSISPFQNEDEGYDYAGIIIENGTKSMLIDVVKTFGKSGDDLKTLEGLHTLFGKMVAVIKSEPSLPLTAEPYIDPDAVVLVKNPFVIES